MTASGPAVVIGAGNVGCGVMAEQLRATGRSVVMVTRTQRDAERIVGGGVRVRYADGRTSPDVVLRALRAVPVADTSNVTTYIREASVVVVAVGSGHAVQIAPLLARTLMARRSPVNVVVCDNSAGAATHLRAMVAEHGDDRVLQHGYVGALVDRIVTRREQRDGSRVLLTESRGAVYLDAPSLRAPLEAVGQLCLVENFQAYVLRKLFLFSAGHAASAYLGGMRGHRRIREALTDVDVASVVRAAMLEGQAGLSACFGEWFSGGAVAVDQSMRRYAAPHLDDTVERVGRDPLRKLGATDRICGSARLAMAAGKTTPALALVTAAALRLGQHDPKLQEQLGRLGRGGVVVRSSGLPPTHRFVELVLAADRMLDSDSQLSSVHARLAERAELLAQKSPQSDTGTSR
jgi:mannitol-1-phosphate 5-dehydrogenase